MGVGRLGGESGAGNGSCDPGAVAVGVGLSSMDSLSLIACIDTVLAVAAIGTIRWAKRGFRLVPELGHHGFWRAASIAAGIGLFFVPWPFPMDGAQGRVARLIGLPVPIGVAMDVHGHRVVLPIYEGLVMNPIVICACVDMVRLTLARRRR